MGAFSHQLILKHLSLAFTELKNGAMQSTVNVEILQRERVVLLMREETDHSPSPKWSCRFAQRHRKTANLLAFFAERDILDGSYAYLVGGASVFLELQGVVLNG